ncbi:hypothetical protein FFR93_07390 [Rhizobium sp. MHM7A]|nr:hypothetical protein FFR93_07390 [Rhizobium sp. MHM7A]
MGRPAPSNIARLYHEAFDRYELQCFWSTKRMDEPKFSDVLDAVSRLKRDGDMVARRLAVEIEKAAYAAL